MKTLCNNENAVLSGREQEILELTSWGMSQKEVAEELGISRYTVDVHLKNIKTKTGLQKATELECAYMYRRYNLPLLDLPEMIRKRIATAMLVLSVFTAAMNTTEFVRVLRAPRTTTSARAGRTRRNEDYLTLNFA